MINIMSVNNYDIFKNIIEETFNIYADSFNSEWEVEEGGMYYSIKVLARKKDYLKNNLYGKYKDLFSNHDEALICHKTFSSLEEFEKAFAFCKLIADNIPYGRIYININPKSVRDTICELNNRVNDISKGLILTGELNSNLHKEICNLSKRITNIKESDYNRSYNWYLLDFDNLDEERIKKIEEFEEKLTEGEIKYIKYNTPNGLHILLPHVDSHKFKNKCFPFFKIYDELVNGNDWVEEKTNALALIYVNPNI